MRWGFPFVLYLFFQLLRHGCWFHNHSEVDSIRNHRLTCSAWPVTQKVWTYSEHGLEKGNKAGERSGVQVW